ncbi:DUF4012 domain-containing protein [Patescibacteria group bacterium]|nr:DUF4012 domain-containing protein [Patescibacteria group bacterium]
MDRTYGTSGYHPSHHFSQRHPEPKQRKPSKAKSFLIRLAKWAVALLTVIFIITWLFFGQFRFLVTRFPSLTGFPFGSRTYLVLIQNNGELRPTGGAITAYGELKFSHGLYRGVEWFDANGEITNHKQIDPPLVISALNDNQSYTFQDANFDPDFNLAKEKLTEFYQLTHPEARIDGIIALDQTFMEALLGAQDYTGESLSKIISKSTYLPWAAHRTLSRAATAFEEKHLLASFNRAHLQKQFIKRNWTGALPESSAGDFLAINDAIYSGENQSRYIIRDITYELNVSSRSDVLGNPTINAKTTITYQNENVDTYQSYLRLLVPLGSDLSSTGSISEQRSDIFVIGELTEVQPDETHLYTYEYELPEYVWSNGTYYLHLHKQPGTLADHYRVIVRLAPGLTLQSDQFSSRENFAIFETNLEKDLNLSFQIVEDLSPVIAPTREITEPEASTGTVEEPLTEEPTDEPTQ